MTYGLILALAVGLLALLAAIRLAPDDPTRWHVPVAEQTPPIPGPCADHIRIVPKGARTTCLLSDPAATLLARLDTIALATPRTTRLAGTPEGGRLTWITRSRLMGFPDYVTAEASQTAEGTRLDIFARQRFGQGDWGVNAARLAAWLSPLDQIR